MPLDGLFLSHLVNEIKNDVEDKKIYRIIPLNDTDYVFYLSSKKYLLLSANPSSSHLRLTTKEFLPSNALLANYFKKHIEGGIIKTINQYHNDRLVIIEIEAFDDLGYTKSFKIYLELMGKNSNLVITDGDDIVLEAIRKSYLTDDHIIKTNYKYTPIIDTKISPYDIKENILDFSNIQGLSKQVITEMNDNSFQEVMNRPVEPTLITGEKNIYYFIDLKTIYGERKHFDTLSELLDYYFEVIRKTTNDTQDLINTKKYLNHEIEKLNNKLEKQINELNVASNNDELIRKANLLKVNIYQIKPYATSITLFDYETNQDIKIELNPKLKASENIDFYFNRIKKNRRAVSFLNDLIEETKKDIIYYNDILSTLDYSKIGDLKETMYELGLRKAPVKNVKPHISKYTDKFGNIYYFGKNNIQNNYLTHQMANDNDYFFHVKEVGGSHVILRGELNEDSIKLASNIAAYYSQSSKSVHVCVDYTLVKWVKKVKGEKGSFVTYTHEHTAYADPDIDFINSKAELK